MTDTDLVNGAKIELKKQFEKLYSIHDISWRKKLKMHNPWHSTARGLTAWQNIAKIQEDGKKGTGLEALRLIIADMQKIVESNSKKVILRKQGFARFNE